MYALMDGTTLSLIVGQVSTFLLVVIGFGVALWREHRNRKWDLDDRAYARMELNKKLQTYHIETTDKIDENTRVSKDALHEANDAKVLIASIEESRNKLQQSTIDMASEMKDGAEAISDAVEKIQTNTETSAAALTKLTQAPIPVVQSDRRVKK